MARPKRYHVPGSFYHVMARGNHGQDIFFSNADQLHMSLLLQEGIEKYEHRIHAFCFMKNHIHLLIQVGEISLSKIMQNLSFRYSQKINRKYGRLGRLFQGRFKSILIEEDVYFFRLLRYIHMNPVRANITDRPENYVWSSHNTYLNRNKISWMTSEYGLSKFDKNRDAAIALYSSYVIKEESTEELDELRQGFKDGQVLGDDNFLNNIRDRNNILIENPLCLEEIIEAACLVLNISKELIISPGKSQKASFARSIISLIAFETANISIEHIASYLNRNASTISGLISRIYMRSRNSPKEQSVFDNLRNQVLQIAGSKA